MNSSSDVLYRYETQRYSYIIDADRDAYGVTGPSLRLRTYNVLKRTPCGAWIDADGRQRFVNLKAVKQFACDTPGEAMKSLAARRRRQITILSTRLRQAQEDLALAVDRSGAFSALFDNCCRL